MGSIIVKHRNQKMKKKSIFIVIVLVAVSLSFKPTMKSGNDKKELLINQEKEQNKIKVTDFGARPNSRENAVPFVKKMIEACRGKENIVVEFPIGRYDFWPDNSAGSGSDTLISTGLTIGINLRGLKNITLDGCGSEFIFHGRMTPLSLSESNNVKLINFSIDWDRPLTSQAVVEMVTDEYLQISIDPSKYPYIIETGKLRFTGEGWKSPVVHYLLYDKIHKEVVPLTRDGALGNIFEAKAEELSPGVVRLYGQVPYKPEKGTYIALYGQRESGGINLNRNTNTTLDNIRIYYSPGAGIFSFMCDGLYFNNVNVEANLKKGRVFSSLADAFYFPNCKGLVRIENCTNTGQTDDWANFRGTYAAVVSIPSPKSIEVKMKSGGTKDYYNPGDEICFVEGKSMQRGELYVVNKIQEIKSGSAILTFEADIPKVVGTNYIVENMTWNPEVEVRNCTIPRQNRARGILVSTNRKAIIENNIFRTTGSAILIEGDTKYWFEAGAVRDLTIRNNVFDNCMSSAEPVEWGWGEAIICITPTHQPENANTEPYHKNILIEGNTFRHYDYNLLYARSVRNLTFRNNKIEFTSAYPMHGRKVNFYLDGCRNTEITGNIFGENFPGKNVELHHMHLSDVKIGKDQKLKITSE